MFRSSRNVLKLEIDASVQANEMILNLGTNEIAVMVIVIATEATEVVGDLVALPIGE